jgi:probable F420-dependent oxidoreductase
MAVQLTRPRVGIFADCTDVSMPVVDLAVEAERRGFEGLFLNEHTHLPVHTPRSQFVLGGPTPERYARFWDPYVALSFVAARTALEIGPCVSLVAEHDPIALAKAAATLDVLSGGRLVLGVGFGWNREEFEDHGHPAKVRARVVTESVALMRELWTKDVASFSGEFFQLSPSMSWPKPLQRPGPPVLLGAPASERNFRRIATWADGWIPMGSHLLEPAFAAWLTELRHTCEDSGRDPSSVGITAILIGRDAIRLEEAAELAMDLQVERLLVKVDDGPAGRVLPWLDRLAVPLARIQG